MEEHALTGGNATSAVVRVGNTARKPWTASTPSVNAFVETLRRAGVDAPEPLGRDGRGRSVQEFVAGRRAIDVGVLSRDDLRRVGSIVREIHEASVHFVPPADSVWETAIDAPGSDLVCHNDLAPSNLIMGERWVFIDWDSSAPSTRIWDLAYAAQAFTLNDVNQPVDLAASNLAALVDGYHGDDTIRSSLPGAMSRRAAAMHGLLQAANRTGREPWASMYSDGHGEHWARVAHYVDAHQDAWVSALTPTGTATPTA